MPVVTANGIAIAYEASGDPGAPPMVMVMGLGMPLVFWPDAFVEGLLASGLRLIRFDNRDCGLSQRIEGGARPAVGFAMFQTMLGLKVHGPYTLQDMAGDVVGLLDALQVARAHVVGVSMGGMIGQCLAAGYPERVASLTAIMSSSGNPYAAMAQPRALGAILHRPSDPKDPQSVVDHLVHLFSVIGSPGFPADPVALRALCERVALRGFDPEATQRQMLAILATGDQRRELAKVRAPTLVIHGRDDPLVPLPAGRDVARNIAGAKLMEFDGMGHDMPQALIPQIVAAIADHCRAAEAKYGALRA
jgi:pimeloyl-ACP methyl ester carboxylesterase